MKCLRLNMLPLVGILMAFLFFTNTNTAQNVTVAGALVGNGSYATLEAAFTAINGGAQTGANISVNIVGNTTETLTATLNQGTWNSLSITPAGGVPRAILGNIAGPLVNLNGADRVLIHGLNTGGNSLTFNNQNNTTASTLQFINDARSNTIQECSFLGSNTSTTSGTIFISTSAGGGGNDSISFTACTIDVSGANFPVNGVYADGTAGQENGNIVFNNCNIANFFSATSISRGIFANTSNTDWILNNCRFFQSATRTYTTANTHRAIQIASGNNHAITANTIGFATVAGTGTYTMTSTVATRFIAIDVAVGTTATSNIQGNLIRNISINTSSGASTTNGVLCGINITAGNVNVGNLSGNTIGDLVGAENLVVTPTTPNGTVVGIHSSSTGVILIQNNSIGAMGSSGVTAAVSGGVSGINISGIASSMSILNNTIGGPAGGNLRAGTNGFTTGSSQAVGINLAAMPTLCTVSGNMVQNIRSFGSGTAGYVRGIGTLASTGAAGTPTITNNTIHDLISTSTLTTIANGQASAIGISLSGGTNAVVSNNTIYDVQNLALGTNGSYVVGIGHGNATNSTIRNNTIYNILNYGTSTNPNAPSLAVGIVIRSGTTAVSVYNNMISIGANDNAANVGILLNHGSTPDPVDQLYHNTIHIKGTAVGSISSFGIHRGDFTIAPRNQTVDIRNNLITNTRTGGTGSHYAIGNNFNATSSATGWAANASNNNVLNANATTIGYWGAPLNFANWQSSSASDANSYSGITVTYVNPNNNLHLNMGVTPTSIESGGQTIAMVGTDIDAQVRPGPAGSVNGGAFAPDIGADEIDGVYLDAIAPAITYTPLSFTCTTGDRTLTATIVDFTGVPTSGGLMPRIYYRKNAGAWVSNAGSLVSGSGTNGTWSFTISSATMGGLAIGDVIQYFVIAQDMVGTPNIVSNPSAGLVASNVNTVTTVPTTPNAYAISNTISGNYNVGVGGDFTTLTAAVNAYNTSCLGGPVTFTLIDATYNSSETFPISINANADASAINTLTIQPQNTGTVISGNANAIIKFDNADYVVLNGSVATTANSTCPTVQVSRDLTIINTNTAAATGTVWLSSAGTGLGVTNCVVKNCIIENGVDQSVTATDNYAIVSCGATISIVPPPNGIDNNNNIIENNLITKANWGIFMRGDASNSNDDNIIRLNVVGPTAFGSNQLRKGGIIVQHQNNLLIHDNEVRFVGNQISQSIGGTDHIGIGLGGFDGPTPATTNITNASVHNNYIHDIVCEKTFSAIGIQMAITNVSANGNKVYNNMINNVRSNATSPDQGIGINISSGNGDLVVFNTINMVTADRDPGGATSATQADIGLKVEANAQNPTIADNIIYVDEASNTGTVLNYAMVVPSAGFVWGTGSNNFNDYAINTSNAQNVLFGLGNTGALTQVTTLPLWQTTFTPNQDANSINVTPVFTSSTDLHLVPASNLALNSLGSSIPGITTDYDCETRSSSPDMGADEFCVPAIGNAPTALVNPICAGDTTNLNITGTLYDAVDWSWYTDSCGGTLIGTGPSINVNPTGLTAYYVRGDGGCLVAGNCNVIMINVNPLPTVGYAVVPNDSVCLGDTVNLSGTGANSYTWTGGITDGVDFIPSASAVYTVTGTDVNGCSATATADVTVNLLPTIGYTVAANDSVCEGSTITINGTGADAYVWTGGITDGVSFVATSSLTYTVTGTDANGCSSTATANITVHPLPTVTYSVVSNDTVCEGTSITLNGIGATSYIWSGGVLDGIGFIPPSSQTYTLIGTDVNGCTDTVAVDIVVNSNPTVNLGADIIQPNPPAVLDAGTGFSSYTWSTTETSQTISVNTNGTYIVTVTNAAGCSDADTIQVNFTAGIMNPDGSVALISLYPNPTTSLVNLSVQNMEAENVITEILDMTGKVVLYTNPLHINGNYMFTYDVVALRSGLYILRIIANGHASELRFVKQ